jgi:hypothetical protein
VTQHPAWLLVVAGLVMVGVGVLWLLVPSVRWLGNLPGDLRIERGSFRLDFPIVTCLVISLLLTGVLGLIRFFSR